MVAKTFTELATETLVALARDIPLKGVFWRSMISDGRNLIREIEAEEPAAALAAPEYVAAKAAFTAAADAALAP